MMEHTARQLAIRSERLKRTVQPTSRERRDTIVEQSRARG